MADKDQNKGKAFKNHPTIQLARHLAEMTSQIPPCASSHAISHPTDPPARSSDVIPPPSMQGVHSPCNLQPTIPDAGHMLDVTSKKRSVIIRKFSRRQISLYRELRTNPSRWRRKIRVKEKVPRFIQQNKVLHI